MANEPIVHVVDDDPAIRDSLAFLLDTAGLVSRTYESAAALLAHADNLAPTTSRSVRERSRSTAPMS